MNPGAIARAGTLVVAGLLVVPFALLASTRLWAALVVGGTLALVGTSGDPARIHSGSGSCSRSLKRVAFRSSFLSHSPLSGGASPRPSSGRGCSRRRRARYGFLAPVPGNVQVPVLRWRPGLGRLGGRRRGCDRLGGRGVRAHDGPRFGPGPWARPQPFSFRSSWRGSWLLGNQGPQSCRRGSSPRSETTLARATSSSPTRRPPTRLPPTRPVYINDSETGHVADTVENRLRARKRDTRQFLRSRDLSARRDVRFSPAGRRTGSLVDKDRPAPEDFLAGLRPVYQDQRFALYDLHSERPTLGLKSADVRRKERRRGRARLQRREAHPPRSRRCPPSWTASSWWTTPPPTPPASCCKRRARASARASWSIRHERNSGVGAAIVTGYRAALAGGRRTTWWW